MFQAEPMRKVMLIAEKALLVRLVHMLQSLGLVQLIPVSGENETGLTQAAAHTFFPVEANLVALRSIKEYLRLSPPRKWNPIAEGELLLSLPEQMELLAASVRAIREKSEKIQSEEREVERELRALLPYGGLNVELSLLRDYRNLRILSVPVAATLPEFDGTVAELRPMPARRDSGRFSLAARRDSGRFTNCSIPTAAVERPATLLKLWVVEEERAEEFIRLIAETGVQPLSLPELGRRGSPALRLQQLLTRKQTLAENLRQTEQERAALAEEWCVFIHAAEETLVSLLLKNLGTTHFLVSKYAVTGSFWVRTEDFPAVRDSLLEHFPVGLSLYEEEAGEHGTDALSVPTSVKTTPWMRPFALLTEMFDMPGYGELNPTAMLAVCFPLFFGFMIGDCGYGAVMALGGYLLLRRYRTAAFMETVRQLSAILLTGGVVSVLLGFFVFGDAFGIPFAPEEGVVFWWGKWLPYLPHALLLKTEGGSVNDMLILSILAGWLHMGCGCVFGIINELRHSIRHALGHLGQLAVISGVCLLILGLDAFASSNFGQWLWSTVLFPFSLAGTNATEIVLLAGGMALVGIGEGPMGLLEFFGLFGNVVSFTRLALVGVSKAAVAVAVNTVLIPELAAGGSIIRFLLVALALAGAHLAMVFLGCLSASIQAVRLHYCETFSKFFKGGGVRFAPFRFSRVFTRS
jgi:V/A-type H+-transporting ATPase subunit I